MRLALKHQIIMAPAAVLCLMTLLLCFLQFTYWDMSVKRQQAKALKTAFISLAEAEMATQRMQGLVRILKQAEVPDPAVFKQMSNLHDHLAMSVDRLLESGLLPISSMSLLRQSVLDLNPEQGMRLAQFDSSLTLLHPHLTQQINILNQQRDSMSDLHREDIDALVAETTFVTIVVLGCAILIGIFLSLTFARRILSRIKILSDAAARVSDGDFELEPPPEVIYDELDGLAVSISHMTEQLIRVVAAEKMLEGAEDERRRIAMDIHDQTLADLSAVRRGLEQIRQQEPCGEAAASIEVDLQRAMNNLRVVMDNLHPQTLDILGLPAALESFLEKTCEASGSPVYHFLANDDVAALDLPRLTQVTIYRIVVEAVTNTLRHAHSNQLEVSMELRSGTLVVAVEDNGRGFDSVPLLPTSSGGRGLHNIRERVRAIGAQASWCNSRFSSGTRFELVLPLQA